LLPTVQRHGFMTEPCRWILRFLTRRWTLL
jgi:hypothetical protein